MYRQVSGLHLSLVNILTFKRSLNDEQEAGSYARTTNIHVSNPSFSCYLSAKYQKTSRFVGAVLLLNCQQHDLCSAAILQRSSCCVQKHIRYNSTPPPRQKKRRGFFFGNSSTQECGSPYMRGLTSCPNNMQRTRLIIRAIAPFSATQYCNFMTSYCLSLLLWIFINVL